jgi:hypothetical protein
MQKCGGGSGKVVVIAATTRSRSEEISLVGDNTSAGRSF